MLRRKVTFQTCQILTGVEPWWRPRVSHSVSQAYSLVAFQEIPYKYLQECPTQSVSHKRVLQECINMWAFGCAYCILFLPGNHMRILWIWHLMCLTHRFSHVTWTHFTIHWPSQLQYWNQNAFGDIHIEFLVLVELKPLSAGLCHACVDRTMYCHQKTCPQKYQKC